jgi:hypothetical protein
MSVSAESNRVYTDVQVKATSLSRLQKPQIYRVVRHYCRQFLIIIVCLTAVMSFCRAEEQDPVLPLRWGFDDIGVRGIGCWNENCLLNHPMREQLMQEFSFDLWVTWWPDAACCDWTRAKNKQQMQDVDEFCRNNNIDWILNQVAICWGYGVAPECCVDPEGYDWYCRTPATG